MQIAYTSVDLTTNQLLGVTGITRDIPAGTRVWSRPTISQPIYYTVFDGKLYFDRIIPDSMQGNNLYIDYYKKIEVVEDLYQVLPEHYREIYKWYLRYAIKYRKDNDLPSDDPDLKKFESLVQSLVDNLYTGQETTIITS
jgi:cation transport regulator ChaB